MNPFPCGLDPKPSDEAVCPISERSLLTPNAFAAKVRWQPSDETVCLFNCDAIGSGSECLAAFCGTRSASSYRPQSLSARLRRAAPCSGYGRFFEGSGLGCEGIWG